MVTCARCQKGYSGFFSNYRLFNYAIRFGLFSEFKNKDLCLTCQSELLESIGIDYKGHGAYERGKSRIDELVKNANPQEQYAFIKHTNSDVNYEKERSIKNKRKAQQRIFKPTRSANVSNKGLEIVSLDDMDWFEFQHFTAHLFQKLGFGNPEDVLKGSDCGRDVILHSSSGDLIIIECKHQPKSSIGRPTVQKLHSAILTAHSQKGYLVTTGKFSPAAIDYAKTLGSTIELVDLRVLADMANRAGIKILQKGEKTTVYHVLPPSQELVNEKVINNIVGLALSHPHAPEELTETIIDEISFIPAYLMEYSLHENFSTTVGTIHSVHIDRGQILIDGQDGKLIKPEFAKYVEQSSLIENWQSPQNEIIYSSGKFKLGLSSVKKRGINFVRELNTKNVGYYGGNNVHYSKKCEPKKSSVFVRSLTQVYIPFIKVSSKIISRKHRLQLVGNTHETEVIQSDAGKCEICGNKLDHKRLLCNSCGKVVHTPRLFGHSFTCELCEKTICKECAFWTRKYLFFKKKLCDDCSKKLKAEGKNVKKFEVD